MSTTIPLSIKNSPTLNKRPLTTNLQLGELAVNTNPGSAGLYIRVEDATTSPITSKVVKVGPIAVGATAPVNPGASGLSQGEGWYDTTSSRLKIYIGTAWVAVSGPTVAIGIAPPSGAAIGDLWWSSDDGVLKVYYSDPSGDLYWVDASPMGIGLSGTNAGDATRTSAGLSRQIRDAGDGLGFLTQRDSLAINRLGGDIYLSPPTKSFNPIEDWAGAVVYDTYTPNGGVVLKHEDKYYLVVENHTSDVFTDDLRAGLLRLASWDDASWTAMGAPVLPTGLTGPIYHGLGVSLDNLNTWNNTPDNAGLLLQCHDPYASGFVTLTSLGDAAAYAQGDVKLHAAPGLYSIEGARFKGQVYLDGSEYAAGIPLATPSDFNIINGEYRGAFLDNSYKGKGVVVLYQPLHVGADLDPEVGYRLYTQFYSPLSCRGGTIANVVFLGTIQALTSGTSWHSLVNGVSIPKGSIISMLTAALAALPGSFTSTLGSTTTTYNKSDGQFLELHRGGVPRIEVEGGRLHLDQVVLGGHVYATDSGATSISYGNAPDAPYISLRGGELEVSGLVLLGNEKWEYPLILGGVQSLPLAKRTCALQYGFAAALVGARGLCSYIHNGRGIVNQALYLLPRDTGDVSSTGVLWVASPGIPGTGALQTLAGTTSYLTGGAPNGSWSAWQSNGPMLGSFFQLQSGGLIELGLPPATTACDQNGIAGAFGYLENDPTSGLKVQCQGFAGTANAGVGFSLLGGGGISNIGARPYVTPWVPIQAAGASRTVAASVGTASTLYASLLNINCRRFAPGVIRLPSLDSSYITADQTTGTVTNPGTWGGLIISTNSNTGLEV